MQTLEIYQSLWAMERRHTDGFERSVEQNVEMIHKAGFDGVTTLWDSRDRVRRIDALIRPLGLHAEGQALPKTVDELQPILELATEFRVHHIDLQPDVRPRTLKESLELLDGWSRLAEQVDFPVYIETHRDRMTTDLFFMLDILDARPDLKLLGDISHYLVGREFAWPVSAENHAMMHRILDSSWAFHGRVASREQVQIEISFPPHKPWVDLHMGWWRHGFESWQRRAGPDDSLTFTCELGPKPYAIIGRDGNDTTGPLGRVPADAGLDPRALERHAAKEARLMNTTLRTPGRRPRRGPVGGSHRFTAMTAASTHRLRPADCSVEDLARLVLAPAAAPTPFAGEQMQGVPVYDCPALRLQLWADPTVRPRLMAEWAEVSPAAPASSRCAAPMRTRAWSTAATAQFRALIEAEKRARLHGGTGGGDHFAKPRRQRPGLERAGEVLPARARAVRRLLRQRRRRPRQRGLARPGLPDHPRRSTA